MSINSVVNDTVANESLVNAQKPKPPTITGYTISGLDDTALDPAGGQTILLNGTGFQRGATVTINGVAVAVVSFVNANQLSFTSPAQSAGTYTIYAVNADGGTAIYIPGLIYSNLPTWTTAAGTLGSYYETQAVSNTVVASGDAPVTYSVLSGALPTGAVFNANGVITGTAPADSGSTTYSFTIQATDAQLQDSTRSFSLTINTDVVSWSTPANGTTYTSVAGTAIANVSLLATSVAGSAVSYSANALPTGVALTGNVISGTPSVVGSSSTLLTATATSTTRSATRTINWTINVASDTYFKNTTLLLPGAGTTFVKDASTNNFAITVNGDTKPNSLNPYTPGYYSNYFDGTGDDLSLTMTGGLGAGDFTLEYWFYPTSLYNYITTFCTTRGSTGFNVGTDSAGLLVWYSSSARQIQGGTIIANQWHHAAFVRSGSTLTGYLNGVSVGTATVTTNFSDTSARIGSLSGGGENITGYLSNLRVVVGTAVYTANFTPSTTPLTAIANTSLLTCQSNRFIDNSANAFTITRAGDTAIKSFHPFTPNTSYSTYGSAYSDGNGDYIAVADNSNLAFGTGDYTIEMWVYLISYAQSSFWESNPFGTTGQRPNGFIWYQASGVVYVFFNGSNFLISSANVIPLAQWAHIALVRNSGATAFYVNGVNVAAASTTYNSTNGAGIVGAFCDGGTYSINGYISNLRAVKGTAVYTSNFTPPSAPLTAIANTQLLTLQNNQSANNNVFLDNSTNNFAITRNGNATQGSFTPYGGNWSNYFDGTGDYLTTPTGQIPLTLGTSNFTIEMWAYPTTQVRGNPALFTSDPGVGLANAILVQFVGTTGQTILWVNNTNLTASSTTNYIVLNQWNHIAVVRSGGSTYAMYINGVAVNNVATNSTSLTTNSWYVGYWTVADNAYTGYISNFRIVKSTAVYTSNFTPSTTPLTAITNTTLLTCQSNSFVDNSANNFAITKAGDVSVQRFSPFNPVSVTPASYSGYFDGSGDYLTIPYSTTAFDWWTNDYTIEAWVYASSWSSWSVSPSTQPGLIGNYSEAENTNYWCFGPTADGTVKFYYWNGAQNYVTSTATVSVNQWNHIAVTKTSSGIKVWVNGVGNTATAISGTPLSSATYSLVIGKTYTATGIIGNVSNLRIVKWTAVYTSNFTPSTTPLTAIVNTQLLTCQSPTFVDNSGNNLTISTAGDAKPSIQNPFGSTSATTNGYSVSTIGGSAYFDGSGDYLTLAANSSLTITAGPSFTMEAWIYPVTNSESTPMIASQDYGGGDNQCFQFRYNTSNNTVQFTYWTSSARASAVGAVTTNTITLNQWNHVAVSWTGTTLYLFINGVVGFSGAVSTMYGGQNNPTSIGILSTGNPTAYFKGYISDLRMIKGTALYTSNFVPPAAPSTAITNTQLLLNFTSAGIYDASTQNNLETVGDAKLSTAVTKFGSTSLYFDGNLDYVSARNSVLYDFGSGDFTIEAWVYISARGSSGSCFASTWASSGRGWIWLCTSTTLSFVYSTNGTNETSAPAATYTVPLTTWTHLAAVRYGNTITMYANGNSVGSASVTGVTINPSTQPLYIGANKQDVDSSINNYQMNGYIDDFRITRGYARYTANFTPPTEAFQIK